MYSRKQSHIFLSIIIGSLLLSWHCSYGDTPPPSTSLSLIDCLNTALERNSDILAAKQDLEASKGVVVSTRAVLYPKLSASLRVEMENADLFEDKPDDQLPVINGVRTRTRFREDWILQVTVSHSLYSGGKNRHNIAISELQKEIQYIILQETIHEVLFEAKQAFSRVLLARNQAKTQAAIIKLLEKEVSRQKSLFEAGRSTKFNIVRTEVRLANERPTMIRAMTEMKIAAIDLAEIMGIQWQGGREDLPINIVGTLDCPPVKFELNALIDKALARRPDPLRFGKLAEIEKRRTKIARASNIPTIDLFVSGRTEREDERIKNNNFFDSESEVSIGFKGVWNIFDGFEGKGQAETAEAKQKGFEIQRDDSLRKVELDVRRAYLRLRRAQKVLLSQLDNVKKAEDSIDLAKSSVEAGFGSQFDILQATVDFNQAQNIEQQARFDYHLAMAELEKSTFSRQLVAFEQHTSTGN